MDQSKLPQLEKIIPKREREKSEEAKEAERMEENEKGKESENRKENRKENKEQKRKSKYKTWFVVGSFQRIWMVLLAYILMLLVLLTSFFAASYLYWFGGETADSYWETQRFQKKLTSQIKKAAPAVRHYLSQDIQDDEKEMVEIYTLEEESIENGEVLISWKKTAGYTCESGAEIVGIETNVKNTELEPQVVYKKKNDSFLFMNDFNELDTNFVTCWESFYRNREHNGVQKYCAVSSETMKEWILDKESIYESDYNYYGNYPENGHYVICNYHYGKGYNTMLCYVKKKDKWYYFKMGEDGEIVDEIEFRMPDVVYFPLYGIAEEDKQEKKEENKKEKKKEEDTEEEISIKESIKEFSDGFSIANLYLKNGEVFSKIFDSSVAIEDDMLTDSPFFSLKTILYEAGKEYYQKKELLHYINAKLEGYLWNFTFHGDSGNMMIGSEEGRSTDSKDIKRWKFSVDFEGEETGLLEQEEPWITALIMIGKQQGYHSMTIDLALPKSLVTKSLFSPISTTRDMEEIRRSFEAFVFSYGSFCIFFAIISLCCWLYLVIRLLFGKENTIGTEVEIKGDFYRNKQRRLSLEWLPIEIRVAIIAASIFLAYLLTDYIGNIDIPALNILLLFFDISLLYFLIYSNIASLVRLLRGNMLWENFLIVRGLKWLKRKYRDFMETIWYDLGYKRKTILLAFGYVAGNIICGGIGIILMKEYIYHYYRRSYLLMGFILLVILLLLQIKAISYVLKNEIGKDRIMKAIRELSQGNLESKITTENLSGEYLNMAQLLPNIQDGMNKAVQKSLRDEHMKTELITNVSHDIKTPLTSIINYIDLLKRAKPQGENVDHYLEVLTQKSQRLKQLIEDLVEASKASSGALPLENRNLDLTELIQQATGEFEEKLAQKRLQVLIDMPKPPIIIFADGRRMFRILENLLQNVYKYALEGTRVYLDLKVEDEKKAILTLRNISAAPLNITEEELTERFVRGEESRTTEGSGLGLSIAKDLAKLQGGSFSLKIDGDLFKVILVFPIIENEMIGNNETIGNIEESSLEIK